MYSSITYDLQGKTILVVEDDYDIGDIIEQYLKREGMLVFRAMNGRQALEMHKQNSIDLMLLDVKLPEIMGWDVLTQLRQYSLTPVIMLTALDQDIDKVMALRIGADDFVVKPFNPNEVVARIQAVLRRTQANQNLEQHLCHKNIELHTDTYTVYIHQHGKKSALAITLTEYKILLLLLNQPYKVFSRTELMTKCLPDSDALERTVDSHVSKLRKKLEDRGITDLLMNVRGVGYRLDSSE